jgi:transposase-like protein
MSKRKHSPEFREQAVEQTLTGNESIKDIAAGLGISCWIVRRDVGLSRRRSWKIVRRTAP